MVRMEDDIRYLFCKLVRFVFRIGKVGRDVVKNLIITETVTSP